MHADYIKNGLWFSRPRLKTGLAFIRIRACRSCASKAGGGVHERATRGSVSEVDGLVLTVSRDPKVERPRASWDELERRARRFNYAVGNAEVAALLLAPPDENSGLIGYSLLFSRCVSRCSENRACCRTHSGCEALAARRRAISVAGR